MSKKSLIASRLRELLDYDPVTGDFRWKVRPVRKEFLRTDRTWNSRFAGKIAGSINPDGYRQIIVEERKYLASRLAWLHMTGEWPPFHIDHKDGNSANDRFANLRSATHAENHQNLALRKNNTSGFHGVTYYRQTNRWLAQISVNSKRIKVGYFKTAEEAGAAYLEAKSRLHRFQPIPRDLAS